MIVWPMLIGLIANGPPLSVAASLADGRSSVAICGRQDLGQVEVSRAGDEIVARAEGQCDAPPTVPPGSSIKTLAVVGEGPWMVARIGVAAGAEHAIMRDARCLTIIVEAPQAAAPALSLPPADPNAVPVAELYPRLFPVSPTAASDVAEAGVPAAASPTAMDDSPARDADAARGLAIGRVTLRPWLTAGYIDAQYAPPESSGAAASRERFFQIQPRLDLSAPIGAGTLRGGYEPRFREGSSLAALRTTSHLVDGALSLPLGTTSEVDVADHFSRGVLETDEVDPGREYFYDLATFTSHQLRLGVRRELGASVNLRLGAEAGRLRFDRTAGFFGYDRRGLSADLGRELTPNLRLALGAEYDEISAPDHPLADMHAITANARLDGDLAPLTRGSVVVGWSRQRNPHAPLSGQRFDGLTTNVSLRRELGYSSSAALSATRGTHPSAFGENGFFVTTAGQLELTLALPFAVSFRGGTGYHVNQYRVVITEIGKPRRDQIVFWSAGLGRAVGRWGFWRVDYRGERRTSNVAVFEHNVTTLVVRIGVGYFQETKRP